MNREICLNDSRTSDIRYWLMVQRISARKPVDMVNSSPFLYRVSYIPGGWEWDFWSINSMRINVCVCVCKRKCTWQTLRLWPLWDAKVQLVDKGCWWPPPNLISWEIQVSLNHLEYPVQVRLKHIQCFQKLITKIQLLTNVTSPKINMEAPKNGLEDDFAVQMGVFSGSMLVFGVYQIEICQVTNSSKKPPLETAAVPRAAKMPCKWEKRRTTKKHWLLSTIPHTSGFAIITWNNPKR